MTSTCRLCGGTKAADDLVIQLTAISEVGNVSFQKLVEYFCQIKLISNSRLSKSVCRSCKESLVNFIHFCDKVDTYQRIVAKQAIAKPETLENQVIEEVPTMDAQENFEMETLNFDEALDSPVSTEDTGYSEAASESGSYSNFQGQSASVPPLPEVKDCSVALERLPIEYVESDPEDFEDEDDENEMNRTLNASVQSMPSPGKRMRISAPGAPYECRFSVSSPMKLRLVSFLQHRQFPDGFLNLISFQNKLAKDEDEEKSDGTITNFKSYHKFFEQEFIHDYGDSAFNLLVPEPARKLDGSIIGEHLEKLVSWDSIELKCMAARCKEKFDSPFKLLLHKKKRHPDQGQFIKCPACPMKTPLLDFSQFIEHVIDNHHRDLRYW